MNSFRLFILILLITLPGCRPGGEPARPPVMLEHDVKEAIKTALASMNKPVALHFYQGGTEKAHRETRAVLEFMDETSHLISLIDHSLEPAVDNIGPGLIPGADYGPVTGMEGVNAGPLFYYGYPERKELKPFLDGVLMASGIQADLPAGVDQFLSDLDQDVSIRIFTTPD